MGLFSSPDADKLAALFASTDLSTIAWAETLANVAPNGAEFVDVVVTSPKRAFVLAASDQHYIGLTYWPDGPVVRGVQNYQEGQTLTFRNVPVRRDATLAVAIGAGGTFRDLPTLAVDVRLAGGGPTDSFAAPADPTGDFGKYAGLTVGAVMFLAVLYVVLKAD